MSGAAYFISKWAERALVKPLLLLLDEKGLLPLSEVLEVQVSSPLEAVSWDIAVIYSGGVFRVDVKVAARARVQLSPRTSRDIKLSLGQKIPVLVYVPSKVHLIFPSDLPRLPQVIGLDFLNLLPTYPVDPKTSRLVEYAYEAMLAT